MPTPSIATCSSFAMRAPDRPPSGPNWIRKIKHDGCERRHYKVDCRGQRGFHGYARLLRVLDEGMSNGLARSFDRLLRIVE
jgi:hypothetical protein